MASLKNHLTTIVLILILLVYLQYYLKYNTSYQIIQTELSKMSSNVLYEKYPIIISDRLVDPKSLLSTLFKYTYITKIIEDRPPTVNITACMSKYTLIYSTTDDIFVNIISPTYIYFKNQEIDSADIAFVTIKLKKQQVLILPSFWLYQSNSQHTSISLNDLFSSLASVCISLKEKTSHLLKSRSATSTITGSSTIHLGKDGVDNP